MKKLYRIAFLALFLVANLSLWAQKEDNVVSPVEIRLKDCLIFDNLGTDPDLTLTHVNLVMKPVYYEDEEEESMIYWRIELYSMFGKLKLKDEFDRPRGFENVDDGFYLYAGEKNYGLVVDLRNPTVLIINKLGKDGPEKQFIISSDDTSWIDYFINWAYYQPSALDYEARNSIKKYNLKEEFLLAWVKGETRKKLFQIQNDLIESFPNGFSTQRDKKLPTLKQLDRRMKANFGISNYFDPVTTEENNYGKPTSPSTEKPVTQPITTQPQQTSTPTSTSTSSYSSSSSTYNKYSHWPLFYSNPVFGFRFGYAQRAMRNVGSVMDIDVGNPPYLTVFGENGVMNGFQAGFFIIPSRKSMLTLNFGLNYEMYFCSGKNAQNYYREYKEINLYAPFDLTFHIPFSRRSALYVHGGLGFDYSCYNDYSSMERNEYGRNARDQFNISWECGLDLKIQGLILYSNFQKGISKHYPYGFENPMEFDKISVGIAFGF